MEINIKLFASLRDLFGRSEIHIEYDQEITARKVWDDINDGFFEGDILVAVNKTYAPLDKQLCDGDEVAFFPPVTGG